MTYEIQNLNRREVKRAARNPYAGVLLITGRKESTFYVHPLRVGLKVNKVMKAVYGIKALHFVFTAEDLKGDRYTVVVEQKRGDVLGLRRCRAWVVNTPTDFNVPMYPSTRDEYV